MVHVPINMSTAADWVSTVVSSFIRNVILCGPWLQRDFLRVLNAWEGKIFSEDTRPPLSCLKKRDVRNVILQSLPLYSPFSRPTFTTLSSRSLAPSAFQIRCKNWIMLRVSYLHTFKGPTGLGPTGSVWVKYQGCVNSPYSLEAARRRDHAI